jgi:hypothetical protein
MERGADRSGPDPQLATHDFDPRDVRDVDAALDLLPDRIEEQFSGGGDPTADHDPVDPEQDHDIACADSQVPADVAKPLPRALVPGPRGGH